MNQWGGYHMYIYIYTHLYMHTSVPISAYAHYGLCLYKDTCMNLCILHKLFEGSGLRAFGTLRGFRRSGLGLRAEG